MVWVSATHGYAAASVERVGQRAGTSRRTFYTHFANREECFIAALEQGFARLYDALAACCAEQDTSVARLQAAAWEVICLIEDEPMLTRMCVVEALAARVAEILTEAAGAHQDRTQELLTVPEAAEHLRCRSRQRVDDLLSQGKLTRVKDGRRTLIARDELDRYLAGEPTGPAPAPRRAARRTAPYAGPC